MKQCKGYKYRIYPTSAQQYMLAHTFSSVRAVYNHFLSVRSEAWKTSRESVSYTQTSKMLTCLKHTDGFTRLTEVDSMALQESLRDLDNAYKNFFAKKAGCPKFHSKRSSFQSYRTRNQSGGIRFEGGKLILPKLGAVKIKKSRDFDGRILNTTVSKPQQENTLFSYALKRMLSQSLAPVNPAGRFDSGLRHQKHTGQRRAA